MKEQPIYDQQEGLLKKQSEEFLTLLQRRGILADDRISSEARQKADMDKKRKAYHNTMLMLQNYRNIAWALACFPAHIAEELDRPMEGLDALLSMVDVELSLGNRKLEGRLQSIQRSRLLLDRVNEALTMLKTKPRNGDLMYRIIYETYIIPEVLTHTQLLFRLNISSRHYYRLRPQAINLLSMRLWAAPAEELDAWLEVMTLLELR
jgi:hypothetical protein